MKRKLGKKPAFLIKKLMSVYGYRALLNPAMNAAQVCKYDNKVMLTAKVLKTI